VKLKLRVKRLLPKVKGLRAKKVLKERAKAKEVRGKVEKVEPVKRAKKVSTNHLQQENSLLKMVIIFAATTVTT